MARGELPHLRALADGGTFSPLRTTCPAVSPVAWASFLSGVNPGKHGIFDFLKLDPATHRLALSSVAWRGREGRRRMIPLRRSRPFWEILGRHGVFSTVLRVPMTFPPEPFDGLLLSGMCVPDLRGTQGECTLFSEDAGDEASAGCRLCGVEREGRTTLARLPGPSRNGRESFERLRIRLRGDGCALETSEERIELETGRLSPWVRVAFRTGVRRVAGICRFCLLATNPGLRLYASAIHIDPARPAMPLSHPRAYSTYLAGKLGAYATLGLAEDTSAYRAGILPRDVFVTSAYDIDGERVRMLLDALDRTREGLCACVFDLTDRVQHVFQSDWKTPGGGEVTKAYRAADTLVGRVVERLSEDDVLLVMSDHGFTGFGRSVHLNAWLREQGWLAADGATGEDMLRNVDWSRTRACAVGLAGIRLNVRSRERQGTVEPGEATALKLEIMSALERLTDPMTGRRAVARAYDSSETLSGPYAKDAPDILVGFADGCRMAWGSAAGGTDGPVFSDNEDRWDGDHCVDPPLVPGCLFSNRKLTFHEGTPHIMDIAPGVLRLFGVEPPEHMDGRAFGVEGAHGE